MNWFTDRLRPVRYPSPIVTVSILAIQPGRKAGLLLVACFAGGPFRKPDWPLSGPGMAKGVSTPVLNLRVGLNKRPQQRAEAEVAGRKRGGVVIRRSGHSLLDYKSGLIWKVEWPNSASTIQRRIPSAAWAA